MPYFVTPNDNYMETGAINLSTRGLGTRLLLLLFSYGLGIFAMFALFFAFLPVWGSGPSPGPSVRDIPLVLQFGLVLVALAVASLDMLIKWIMLRRIGGKPERGIANLLTIRRIGMNLRSAGFIFMYVYAPNLYLTRDEFMRLNVAPRVIGALVICAVLLFAPYLIQLPVIVTIFIPILSWVYMAFNVTTARRYPADTLFIESMGGVVRIFTTINPA